MNNSHPNSGEFGYLHALDNNLPLPIGTQDVLLLDTAYVDIDDDLFHDEDDEAAEGAVGESDQRFQDQARQIYGLYQSQYVRRFRWLPANRFVKELRRDFLKDTTVLIEILNEFGEWRPEHDPKLDALVKLISAATTYGESGPPIIGMRTRHLALNLPNLRNLLEKLDMRLRVSVD